MGFAEDPTTEAGVSTASMRTADAVAAASAVAAAAVSVPCHVFCRICLVMVCIHTANDELS